MRPTDRKKTYVMPYYADFVAKRSVRLPYAYLIPIAGTEVPDKLRQHGIAVERLTEAATLETEAFRLKEIKGAERLYQGHRTNTVKGEYAVEKREFPKGTSSSGWPSPWAGWPPTSSSRRATTAFSSGIISTRISSASGAAGRKPTPFISFIPLRTWLQTESNN